MTRRSLTPFLLVAVFAAPFVGAWLLYLNPAFVPAAKANHGELIDPATPMGDLVLGGEVGAPAAGAELPLDALDDQWILLLPFPTCDSGCLDLLMQTRQVRLALGLERERLVRVLVLRDPPARALTALLHEQHPDLRLAVGEPGYQRLLQRLRQARPEVAGTYLVDPLRNLMMHHPSDAPPKGLLKDLQRLLKLSKHWGTHAGR